MVETAELAGSFDCPNVFGILNHADDASVPLGIRADCTLLALTNIAAGNAEANLLLYLAKNICKLVGNLGVCVNQVKGYALGALGAYSRQPTQLVNELLDYTVIHLDFAL